MHTMPVTRKLDAGIPVLKHAMVRRQQNAATRIQTAWRRHTAMHRYRLSQRRILRLQSLWRCKLARRELRKRRQAARAADKILQDKKDLEQRVAELLRVLEQARVERSGFRQALRVRDRCMQIAEVLQRSCSIKAKA